MERISLVSDSWSSDSVDCVRGFWSRLRGLKDRPLGSAVLIRTRSVHAFGFGRPFRAVGLTTDLEVASTRVLHPGQVTYFVGCRYVLELPIEQAPPSVGTRLSVARA